jgi:hypothetical protein
MWTLFEPVHIVTYFASEARQAFEQAGLRGFWRGYFAGRTAPIGAVDAPIVIATFFNFAPSFVRRAVPAVWDLITPEEALRAREAGAVAAIRRILECSDGQPVPDSLRAAADLLLAATEGLELAGRPLGGPNAGLPAPADPVARLWHAATVLREHRGDGHIAALVAADIDGCEALVLRLAVDAAGAGGAGAGAADAGAADAGAADAAGAAGAADAAGAPGAASAGAAGRGARPVLSRGRIQAVRGWTDAEWDQAAERLRDRGWLDSAGGATATGLAAHQAVEEATDLAAARPWARLGAARTAELAELLAPVAAACAATLPYPNPVGVPPPAIRPTTAAAQAATAGRATTAAGAVTGSADAPAGA